MKCTQQLLTQQLRQPQPVDKREDAVHYSTARALHCKVTRQQRASDRCYLCVSRRPSRLPGLRASSVPPSPLSQRPGENPWLAWLAGERVPHSTVHSAARCVSIARSFPPAETVNTNIACMTNHRCSLHVVMCTSSHDQLLLVLLTSVAEKRLRRRSGARMSPALNGAIRTEPLWSAPIRIERPA